jgi:hypothetical protein
MRLRSKIGERRSHFGLLELQYPADNTRYICPGGGLKERETWQPRSKKLRSYIYTMPGFISIQNVGKISKFVYRLLWLLREGGTRALY